MTSLGFQVSSVAASANMSSALAGKQVVVISQTAPAGTVGTQFRTATVPVLVMAPGVLGSSGMGMTAGTSFGTTASGQTSVAIQSSATTAPLVAGLTGTVAVNLASSPIGWGTPGTSTGTIKAAIVSGQTNQATLFAYPQGVTMPGLAAPARRAFVSPNNLGATNLNSNGWLLFDTALRWTVSSEALFVVGSTTLTAADRTLRKFIEALGYAVTARDHSAVTTAEATGKKVVIISSTVTPATVGTKFRTVTVPVVVCDPGVLPNMAMTGGTSGTDFGTATGDSVAIALPAHTLAAGLTGTVKVAVASSSLNWGVPAASADNAATVIGNASRSTLFGYDTNDVMFSLNAPARRVGLFLGDTTPASLSSDGWALVRAAIAWATNSEAPPTCLRPLDVMQVIDRSGSMNTPSSKFTDAKNAAKSFVDAVHLANDQVGIVAFSTQALPPFPLSNDGPAIKQAIDDIPAPPDGDTNIGSGIAAAQSQLAGLDHNPAAAPIIVLMTDGVNTAGALPPVVDAANAAKAAGTRIIAIGLGADVSEAELRQLVSSSTDYYFAPASADLAGIYALIAGTLCTNTAPSVAAGMDQSVTLASGASLAGSATDDGQPPGGSLTYAWSLVSAPAGGSVVFANPTSATTTATFNVASATPYILRLSVNDGVQTGVDDVAVTVSANAAPVVSAGPDASITLPAGASLSGSVTDDGLPLGGSLSVSWSKDSGPGTVTFTPPNATSSTATFDTAGTYVLRLTASDSALSSSDTLTVVVSIPPGAALSVADTSIVEGHSGLTSVAVAVSLSEPAGTPVTVSYVTEDLTAAAGCDYLSQTGVLTFAAGETTRSVVVPIVGERAVEPNEGFKVRIGGAAGAPIADNEGVVTITNDDVANSAPAALTGRTPVDATYADPIPTLSWTGSDPDLDALTYDVYVGTTFALDGQEWSRQCPVGAGPAARSGTATAYDDVNDRMIVFGGRTATVDVAEVWVLRNATGMGGAPQWSAVTASGGPSPRQRAAAAYDAASNRLIVVGGCAGACTSALGDAWVLTNANGLGGTPAWLALPAPPQALFGQAAGYDDVDHRLVLFGGSDGSAPTADVYVLRNANGTGTPQWQIAAPQGPGPAAREGASAAYDSTYERMFVFGGRLADGSVSNELWTLQDPSWNPTSFWGQSPSSGAWPAARSGHTSFYDPAGSRLLVFGGVGVPVGSGPGFATNDAWAFTESSAGWVRLDPEGTLPAPRSQMSSAYSPSRARMFVAGGRDDRATPPLRDDVWTLSDPLGRLPLVSASQAASTIVAPTTTYGPHYWRVVSKDAHGAVNGSPAWSFYPDPGSVNQAPTVDAGPDRALSLPDAEPTLAATVSDDGLQAVLTIAWSQVSGPAPATIGTPDQATTTVKLDGVGTYVFRVTVNDGAETVTDDVIVELGPFTGCELPPGLKAWWPGDGHSVDLVAGRRVEVAQYSAYAPGVRGQGFSFDGGRSIDFGNGVGNFGTGDFTISFWASTPFVSLFSGSAVLSQRASCTDSNSWDVRISGDRRVTAELGAPPLLNSVSSMGPLSLNAFHNVTVVRQGPEVRLYVDGLLHGSHVTTGTVDLNNTVSMIAGQGACNGFFSGTLDELMLYERALSAEEVAAHAFTGAVGTCPGVNQAPSVGAGPDITLLAPEDDAQLSATVVDDGLPAGGTLTFSWSVVAAPAGGVATFTPPGQLSTNAHFSQAGQYTVRLTVSDSMATVSDDVIVTVSDRPDLAVTAVDRSGLRIDGQTLTASGTLAATIANGGGASGPFQVTFFEDRNANGTYEPAADALVGTASVPGEAAGASIAITTAASGSVLFAGNAVHAFVDSALAVEESNEFNNYGSSFGCETAPPAPTGTFSPTLKWSWTSSSVSPTSRNVMMTPAVADLNLDGIPDVVFASFDQLPDGGTGTSPRLRALNGHTGAELFTVTDPVDNVAGLTQIAVGNLDGDPEPEIVGVHTSKTRLIAFEHNGTLKWVSAPTEETVWGGVALADLDGDGHTEIVAGRQALNGNGTLRWTGTGGKGDNNVGSLSLVADVNLDGSPEVVAGNTVYTASGSILWQNTSIPDGFDAVANLDADPYPEIVVVGANMVFALEHTGALKWGPVWLPDAARGGAPTIADMDGDGSPEIGVAGARKYVALRANGTVKWTAVTEDISSSVTSSSVFDFDGDGAAEVVYADERKLWVFRGVDGSVRFQQPLGSCTAYENPVVADVDADGSADIVAVANSVDWIGCPHLGVSGLFVYSSPNWVPTRRLWNQHSYHITNVNDDLTIPAHERANWHLYNNYRQNRLTQGCEVGRPDLEPSFVRRSNGPGTITLTARIGNSGGKPAPTGVPVSFYAGQPGAGGTLIQSTVTASPLATGAFADVSVTVPSSTTALPLWVVADDPALPVDESDETNNAYNTRLFLNAPPNQPPSVQAGPDQRLAHPQLVASLDGTVSDDGQPLNTLTLRWTVLSGPGSAALSNATAADGTVTFGAPGTYVLRLTADDQELTASDDVTIVVEPANQAPTVNAGPDQAIGTLTAALDASVADDGLPFGAALTHQWSMVSGTAAVQFGNPSAVDTNVTFAAEGVYVLRLTSSDSVLSGSDLVSVTVTLPANQPPAVSAGPDRSVPIATPTAALDGTVTDDGLPPGSAITVAWSQTSGPATATLATPNAVDTTAMFTTPGTYTFRIAASDGRLSTSDDMTVVVQPGSPTGPPPSATLTSPVLDTRITGPVAVVGSAQSNTLAAWVLEHRLKDDGPWTRFASGTSPVTNGTLGTLDPTMLLNGITQIRLTVTDTAGRFAQATTQVVVKEQQKVGNFTVSFVDLEVPVAGLPITVTRSYDSRDKRVGDFGYGWRLSLSDVRVQESAAAGTAYQSTVIPGFFLTYCLQPPTTPTVTLTLPDGRVLDFQMAITPSCQPFAPIQEAQVSYVPVGNTLGTLAPANGGHVYVSASWPGAAELYDDADFSLFDPSLYRYTSPDGRVFLVHDTEGLKSVSDLNGNVLTVGPNGITHSSGKGITVTRDGSGRIETITDPSGQAIEYGYDANGDLVSHTDREDHTTSFGYHLAFPHHLVSIEDPLGRRPIRNEYDAEGRLLRHIDAFGKTIEYTHQLGTRREIVTDRNLKQRVLDYDERGNVLQEIDPNGKVVLRTYDGRNNRLTETLPHDQGAPNPPKTTWTYDPADNVLTVTDPEDHVTTYTYNARRQVLTATDARGAVTTNVYDDKGNLTSTRVNATAGGPVLTESTHTYDAKGNLKTRTTVVDGVPQTTTYSYDGYGNLTHETDPAAHETTYGYDSNGRRTRQTTTRTVAGGGLEVLEARYEYDANGRVTKTIDPDGTSSRTVYDALGRQVESFDKLGHRSATTYDEMGRVIRMEFADGTLEESTFDNEGRRLTSKNRRGKVTSYTYDDVGRMKRTTFPGGAYTENTYDSAGRLTAVRDARGKTTTYEYDDAGRRTKVTFPLSTGVSAETVFTYDANGNQLTVRDPLLRTITYEYDELNRRTKTIFPATSTQPSTYTQTTYDTLGRRKTERDQAGRVTTFGYDTLGHLTSVTDARGKVTSYGYDELGNRVTQTDANNHVTSFRYDKLGREIRRTLPAVAGVSSFETKTYDDAGNLESRTDFAGRVTNYTYDVMNRLLTRTAACPTAPCPPNADVTFTYTDSGRRETATDARGVTSWTYDDRDRLASLTYPDGRKLDYGYDDNGNRTSLVATIAGAPTLTTTYTYDDANRLDLVTDTAGRVYDHGYDANGNRTTLAQPNGTVTTYTYDTLNRLTNLSTVRSSTTIQSYALTLGLAGNRTQIAESDGTVRTYGYDELYRLTSDTVQIGALNQYAKTFVYDDVGNRQTQTTTIGPAGSPGVLVAGTLTYGYDERDRLTSETPGANPPTTYSWDADGNLTTKSGEATYAWDRENCLVRVTKTDGTVVENTYDFDGIRVRTVTTPSSGPASTTNFLVDTSGSLSHVVAETDASGGLVAHYVRGDDLLAVMRPTGSPWTTRFYHADHIGSVRRLTNEAGTITDGYAYSAFGELLAHTGTDPQPYAFTGEPYDPNMDLQHHRARWLNPRTGRFFSTDAFQGSLSVPATLQKYWYASGEPVGHLDPSGLFAGEVGTALSMFAAVNAISGVVTQSATAQVGFLKLIPVRIVERDNPLLPHLTVGPKIYRFMGWDHEQMYYQMQTAQSTWARYGIGVQIAPEIGPVIVDTADVATHLDGQRILHQARLDWWLNHEIPVIFARTVEGLASNGITFYQEGDPWREPSFTVLSSTAVDTTLTHELGHSLRLDDIEDPGRLMHKFGNRSGTALLPAEVGRARESVAHRN